MVQLAERMDRRVWTALLVMVAATGLLGLSSASGSVNPNQITETTTVTITLTMLNITSIQWTTMTAPTYTTSTTTLTETSKTTSTEEVTTSHTTLVPYPTIFVITTIANVTTLTNVVWPSETSLQMGLFAFFLVGVAFGAVTVVGLGGEAKHGELIGGLLAGLGVVLYAIIQFLGVFPSESGELGFGGRFGYTWQALILVITGLLIALGVGCLLRWLTRTKPSGVHPRE